MATEKDCQKLVREALVNAAAEEALRYGPAILHALDHDGEPEGFLEPPARGPQTRKESTTP
jgi:hypothetical protein